MGHDSCCPHGVCNPIHTCAVAALQVRVKSTVSVARTPECATAPVKNLNVEIEYRSVSPGEIDYLGPIPGRPRASSRSSGSSSAVCSRVASTCAQSRRKSGQNGSVSVTTIVYTYSVDHSLGAAHKMRWTRIADENRRDVGTQNGHYQYHPPRRLVELGFRWDILLCTRMLQPIFQVLCSQRPLRRPWCVSRLRIDWCL